MAEGSSFDAGVVTQTGAAIQCTPANGGPISSGAVYRVKNTGAATMALGKDSGVTLANGYPLAAGESVDIPILNLRKVWTIGTAAEKLAWMEVGD